MATCRAGDVLRGADGDAAIYVFARRRGTNAAHTQTGRPTHCWAAPAHVRAQKQQPYQSQQPLPRGSKRQRKCTHTNTQRSPTKYGAGSRRFTCNRGSSIHTVPRHRASARARFR
eukprot:scaffold12140_cov35-Phaeocystis_antarctica.AAC.1